MTVTVEPGPLPARHARRITMRLGALHAQSCFDAADPRANARRVGAALTRMGIEVVAFRGWVELAGAEVDHVWLALVDGPAWDGPARVLDVSFPLHDPGFADALRGWVAGGISGAELAATAARRPLADRVIGEWPPPARYVGAPIWASR